MDALARIGVTTVLRLLVGAAIVAVVFFGWRTVVDTVTAPFKTEAAVAEAANEGFKAAADKNNAGIQARKAASDARKKASEQAVKEAGKKEESRASAILAAPAAGKTALERAANRINVEFQR